MPTPSILVATWGNGLFSVTGKTVHQELADQSVRSLVADGRGGVIAIVGGHSLFRRSHDGEWTAITKSEFELSCCVAIGKAVFVGTDDANILRVDPDGAQQRLTGFDAVAGRDTWYAGSMIIDGKRVGPPLGIRSMAATCDGAALLANVHVGGVPRSTDAGLTWRPTIDINSDVHQVCAHPTQPDVVIAAAGVGLRISRDAGATWTIEQQGLHAHIAPPLLLGETTFSYQRPPTLLRSRARRVSPPDRQQRTTTAFGRRHAEVDRRQGRYQLHRDPRFNGRCDRPIGMPLRVA